MDRLFLNKIEIRKSKIHGWGIFTNCDLFTGEKIEDCNVVILSKEDQIRGTEMNRYMFSYKDEFFITLGLCSNLNGSKEPNVYYILDRENKIASFYAKENINKGDELLLNY